MAVTYVASSTVGGSGTVITINRPAGIAVGDFMLAAVAFRGQTVNITPPAGWTFVRRDDETTHHSLVTYYRFYRAGDPASWTWNLAVTGRYAAGIATYNNVSSSFPVDGLAGQTNSTASTTISGPSVTTTLDNQLLIAIAVSEASGQTITPPAGYTSRFTADAGGSANAGCTTNLSDKFFTPAGTTGPITATQTLTRDSTMQHLSLNQKGVTISASMSATARALTSQLANVSYILQPTQVFATATLTDGASVNNVADLEPTYGTATVSDLVAQVNNVFQPKDIEASANCSAEVTVNNVLGETSCSSSAASELTATVDNVFQLTSIFSSAEVTNNSAVNYVGGSAFGTTGESPLFAAMIYSSASSLESSAFTILQAAVIYSAEASVNALADTLMVVFVIYAGQSSVQAIAQSNLAAAVIYASIGSSLGVAQAVNAAAAIYSASGSKTLGQGEAYLRAGQDPSRGTSTAKLERSNEITVDVIRIR